MEETIRVSEQILGAIPSNRSPKDFPVLAESGVELDSVYKPENIETILNMVMYNQLLSGSCVGQALAKAKSLLEYIQNPENVFLFSGWFLWMNRPRNLSYLLDTEGTSLKDQAEKLVEDGVCFLSQYDLNPRQTSDRISYKDNKDKFYGEVRPALLSSAAGYKADKYLFPETEAEIKQAIKKLGCVCICIPLYPTFSFVQSNGIIPNPQDGESLKGFHTMLIYGWDDNKAVWYGHNSYGRGWGNNGFFSIRKDYPIKEYVAIADDSLLHWADKYFYFLWKKGVTLHERNFDQNISRGETMAILARVLAGGDKNVFPVLNAEHWADKYFKYLNSHGCKVFEKNYDNKVTRGEFMTLLYRVLNKNDTTDVLPFKGEHWAEAYFEALKKLGVVIHEKRFDDSITRGEVMALVSRSLGYKE